jgi:hypothetical protein
MEGITAISDYNSRTSDHYRQTLRTGQIGLVTQIALNRFESIVVNFVKCCARITRIITRTQ